MLFRYVFQWQNKGGGCFFITLFNEKQRGVAFSLRFSMKSKGGCFFTTFFNEKQRGVCAQLCASQGALCVLVRLLCFLLCAPFVRVPAWPVPDSSPLGLTKTTRGKKADKQTNRQTDRAM